MLHLDREPTLTGAEAEGAGITRWSEGGTVVEVAAAFSLPLPPSAAVAMTAFGVRSTLAVANLGCTRPCAGVAQSCGVHPLCGLTSRARTYR